MSRHLIALTAVLLFMSLTACGGAYATVTEGDVAAGDLGIADNALTTSIFATTSISAGGSKRGVYRATVAGEVVFRTAGTGDVDLYLKKGSEPSTSLFDAKSDGPTSAEEARLRVVVGDAVHFLAYGYSNSTARLEVSAPDAEPVVTTIELIASGSITKGASKVGVYTATAAGKLTFKSTGTGDVDLYLRRNAAASASNYDAKGESETANETVSLTVSAGDAINYSLFGYRASTARLVVEVAATNYDTTLWLAVVSEPAAFAAFSTPGGGLSSSGRSGKFLIDSRVPSARKMHFINGNYKVGGAAPDYAKYHYNFAQRLFGLSESIATFNDSTYFTNTNKRFFAGTIQSYKLGDAQALTYAVQFYPDDSIAEETLLEALKVVKATFTIPGVKLAFVATGPQQTFARIGAQAAQLGFALMTIDQVLGDLKYVALNVGEAWGYLKIFPTDSNTLRPIDIPVFDDLPLDLSVVAGTITRAYQDVNSHVNLKSKERNTPNMVLRDASPTQSVLQPFADKPVHLTVTNEGFSLEPTTPEIINQKLAEKLSGPWIPLPVVDDKRLMSFDELCPTLSSACFNSSKAYGGKSSGLGVLAGALGRIDNPTSVSRQYGYELSPRGFGIPVKFYRDMINAPQNAALKAQVDSLIAAEKAGTLAPVDRNARVAEVQKGFLAAFVPGTLVADVTARLKVVNPGIVDFKFRSSATSEDVANFNGAGLYDSFGIDATKADNADLSCRLETETNGVVTKLKVKPKSVQCGIKAVYASLWNSRALVERTFGRLDHVTAGMGITINPSYGDEQANLVLVTRVIGTDAVYGYTLSVQKGENLVTNPLPGTITEFDVALFSDGQRPPRFTTTRYAKPTVADPVMTTTILSEARMAEIVDIAKKLEIAYCKAKPSYYPGGDCKTVWLDTDKPLSLDMEIKVLPDGNLLFKQVREFHGK